MSWPSIDWKGFGHTRGWTTTLLWTPTFKGSSVLNLSTDPVPGLAAKTLQFGDYSTYRIQWHRPAWWKLRQRRKWKQFAKPSTTDRITIPAGEGGSYLVSATASFASGAPLSHGSALVHLSSGERIEARFRPAPPDPPEST